ncbi:MAG: 2-C-methyl-D-erythritol 4-phosphate cytidylyltransferase [Firmicutes bacterium]|nr:2-C-methyl-D-erythritol 4-phosphate cytidylyltransferase [Bacillota bacterium]
MKFFAIIAAAGDGRRIGQGNKLLLDLMGKPVLVHTLEIFQKSVPIEKVVIAAPDKDIDNYWKLVADFNLSKVKEIVGGGNHRQDSIYSALNVIDSADYIVIHDGARPLLNAEFLDKMIKSISGAESLIAAVRVKDTIKKAGKEGIVKETLNREELLAIQTPQIFPAKILKEAHKKALTEVHYATDDSALVERLGAIVKIFEGEEENIKITTPEDIVIAEEILKRRS